MCFKICIACGKNIDPSRTGCGIKSAVGLQCFNVLLLDLESMLFTCRTVSDL